MTERAPQDIGPTALALTDDERAAIYLDDRVKSLRAEVEAAQAAVNEGHGDEVLPVFRVTLSVWREVLEADLLEAECDLEFVRAKIGAMQ